ncbi:unnamed protein product, partial [Closterium sp. NIES-53]
PFTLIIPDTAVKTIPSPSLNSPPPPILPCHLSFSLADSALSLSAAPAPHSFPSPSLPPWPFNPCCCTSPVSPVPLRFLCLGPKHGLITMPSPSPSSRPPSPFSLPSLSFPSPSPSSHPPSSPSPPLSSPPSLAPSPSRSSPPSLPSLPSLPFPPPPLSSTTTICSLPPASSHELSPAIMRESMLTACSSHCVPRSPGTLQQPSASSGCFKHSAGGWEETEQRGMELSM